MIICRAYLSFCCLTNTEKFLLHVNENYKTEGTCKLGGIYLLVSYSLILDFKKLIIWWIKPNIDKNTKI